MGEAKEGNRVRGGGRSTVLARKREVNVWNKLQLVLLVFERQ